MITIVGLSGSLRKHSFNSGLLRASLEAVPEGCALKIGSIEGIPLYNADVEEAEGVPMVVEDLKKYSLTPGAKSPSLRTWCSWSIGRKAS